MRLFIAGLLLLAGIGVALDADLPELGDFGFRHGEFHDWYDRGEPKKDGTPGPLMRPYGNPPVKCCDGDCRPVRARRAGGGGWEVYLDRAWERVPAATIKRNVSPTPNGGAHACASKRTAFAAPAIYCFVPPDPES
jgi:hypothetical protein